MTKLVRTMAKDLAAIGHRPAAQVVFAGLAMAFILYAIPSHAQRRNEARPSEARQSEEWVLLGSQEVDRTRNRERIDLRTSRGRVKSVRLIAKRGELALSQIRVTYVDGRVHTESRTITMNPNDRTRPIDSTGNEAFVDEVELTIRAAR